MRRSLAKFSESEASNHTPSLADFTTTTPELKFSVYTHPVEHPCWNFQPTFCLRPIQRAAKDDIISLVDGLMNANSATKPRMIPIKNLAKNGPVGVLKRCCTMGPARIYPWRRMRRSRAPSSGLDKFFAAQFSAGYITNMFEFDLRQAHNVRDTKWDQLQRVYFLGYAMWNYLAAPFIFVRDGF